MIIMIINNNNNNNNTLVNTLNKYWQHNGSVVCTVAKDHKNISPISQMKVGCKKRGI